MVIQHKCPGCGSDMVFNADTGLLHCESCGRNENIEKMKQQNQGGSYEEFVSWTGRNTYQDESAAQYQCNNCGAILITGADTTATNCSFCGAPMILGNRLSGELAPSKVIPFSITREQAEEAFKKWCKKSILMPDNFKKADRLKSIAGMYVPFWLYDVNGKGEVWGEGKIVHHSRQGNYEITETEYYDLYRNVDLYFNKIPVDASEKMDDATMDKLEPFDYSELQDFKTPYLSGYLAEKYNYTDEQMFPRVQERVASYTMEYIRSTMRQYTSTSIENRKLSIWPKEVHYTLLPVWILCYDYKQMEHCFVMNGQTGKIVGKPPISKGKTVLWFCIIFVIVYILTTFFFLG